MTVHKNIEQLVLHLDLDELQKKNNDKLQNQENDITKYYGHKPVDKIFKICTCRDIKYKKLLIINSPLFQVQQNVPDSTKVALAILINQCCSL